MAIQRGMTQDQCESISEPGKYYVGSVPGLYLQVLLSGYKSWVLRIKINGRQRDIGLGALDKLSVDGATEKAMAMRNGQASVQTEAPWARKLRENSEAAGHALAARVLELAEPAITEAIRRATWEAIGEILGTDRELAREEYRNAA